MNRDVVVGEVMFGVNNKISMHGIIKHSDRVWISFWKFNGSV